MDMIPIRVSFLEYNAVIWRNIQNAFISTEYIIAEKGIHIKNIRSFLNNICELPEILRLKVSISLESELFFHIFFQISLYNPKDFFKYWSA